MIFGDCPYCGAGFTLAVPDATPAFRKEACEACGREFWERYSRIDPECFTLEEFVERYKLVDGEIVDLVAQREAAAEAELLASLTPEQREALEQVRARVREALYQSVENLYLYGDSRGPAPADAETPVGVFNDVILRGAHTPEGLQVTRKLLADSRVDLQKLLERSSRRRRSRK